MYVCMYIYRDVHLSISIYISLYIYVYMYIYVLMSRFCPPAPGSLLGKRAGLERTARDWLEAST